MVSGCVFFVIETCKSFLEVALTQMTPQKSFAALKGINDKGVFVCVSDVLSNINGFSKVLIYKWAMNCLAE